MAYRPRKYSRDEREALREQYGNPSDRETPAVSQYPDGGKAAGLTKGGDNKHSAPIHGTDADGNEVTASFGQGRGEGETLLADGHLTSAEFYEREDGKAVGHDHYDGEGGGTDRGAYTG